MSLSSPAVHIATSLSVFIPISPRLALLSKSFPRSPESAYKSGRPLFRETDPLTDHRRHRTPARYPFTRLEPGLLTGGTASLASPVTAGISKPLDRKDEIAGEIRRPGHLRVRERGGRQKLLPERTRDPSSSSLLASYLPSSGNTEYVFNPSF